MRLAILSSGNGWHVRDLHRAALAQGHHPETVDFRQISAGVGVGACVLDGFDAVLVRTMPPGSLEQVVFRMDVLHRLEAAGVAVYNPPPALEASVDKYVTTARLEAAGLCVPRTFVCQQAEAAMEAFVTLGSDVVVKPIFGSEGRGMMRIDDPDLAWRTLRTLERQQAVIYLQEFVSHPGWDLRAFVLDGAILASMRRHSKNGWRTNVAQGGRGEAVVLTREQKEMAIKAARILRAPIAGVDLLPGPDGRCYLLEVNAVPGWRALSPATGIDVASEVVQFVNNSRGRARRPVNSVMS